MILRELKVYIEIQGNMRYVGNIIGESYQDATFKYDDSYMSSSYGAPISISLPFMEGRFSAEKTMHFFESLLPEGFSRRAIAEWIKADERDYLTILAGLGCECIGAIKVVENDEVEAGSYEKLTTNRVKELAAEGATRSTQILMETHLSLAGASGKVGLFYDEKNNKWYLPKGDAPSTHIVKQSHVRFNNIVLNEQLCMLTAGSVGIDVPKSFIVNIGAGKDEDVLFATQRYDRVEGAGSTIGDFNAPLRLHQEDFAQALDISSIDKYEKSDSGYMKKMFELLRLHSSNPIEDQKELLKRIIFNYLIGNTDGHIKNFSLLYDEKLKSIRLAPAYDIVATRVYNTTSNMSFFIGGDVNINDISRASFIKAADDIGLGRKMVETVFDELSNNFANALEKATHELANAGFENVLELRKRLYM